MSPQGQPGPYAREEKLQKVIDMLQNELQNTKSREG